MIFKSTILTKVLTGYLSPPGMGGVMMMATNASGGGGGKRHHPKSPDGDVADAKSPARKKSGKIEGVDADSDDSSEVSFEPFAMKDLNLSQFRFDPDDDYFPAVDDDSIASEEVHLDASVSSLESFLSDDVGVQQIIVQNREEELSMERIFGEGKAPCGCATCTDVNNVDTTWVEYYHSHPRKSIDIITEKEKMEWMKEKCPNVLDVLLAFDAGMYRQADGSVKGGAMGGDTKNDDDDHSSSSSDTSDHTDSEGEGGDEEAFDYNAVPYHYYPQGRAISSKSLTISFAKKGMWPSYEYKTRLGLKYLPEYQKIKEAGSPGDRLNEMILRMCDEFLDAGFVPIEVIKSAGKLVYVNNPREPFLPNIKDERKQLSKDSGSLRQHFYNSPINLLYRDAESQQKSLEDLRKTRQLREKNVQRKVRAIENCKNSLGIQDEHYVPFYKLSLATREKMDNKNVTVNDLKRYTKQLDAAKELQKRTPDSAQKVTNKHLPTPVAIIDNADLFEYLLKLDKWKGSRTKPPCPLSQFESDLAQFTDLPFSKMLSPSKYDHSYEERWKKDWRRFLGSLTCGMILHCCQNCYVCQRGPSNIESFAELYMYNMDHLLDYYPRFQIVSMITNTSGVRDILLEAIKCRMVCVGHHARDRWKTHQEYEELYRQPNCLSYSKEIYGQEHRTMTEVFGLKEVKALILDLETRGTFFQRTEQILNGITRESLEVILWMHFRVKLSDLVAEVEIQRVFHGEIQRVFDGSINDLKMTSYHFVMRVLKNLCKMLGVKCPNNRCDEMFSQPTPCNEKLDPHEPQEARCKEG